jgi:predicted AAA+ superfamily ATPase
MERGYLPRAMDEVITRTMRSFPALILIGPRATGKTTTAARHASSVARLDDPAEAGAFRADPDAALRGLPEPILLDEWQAVPDVLGSVKRAVDDRPDPGRFLLTGSVRAELERETWPGTGRVIRETMYGLTVAERLTGPTRKTLLDRIAEGIDLGSAADPPDLRGYVELALRSGFPRAWLSGPDDAPRWLESYVEQIATRDAISLEPRRDPLRLRRYLESYAISSASVVDESTLMEASGLNRKTAAAYERLLTDLMLVDALPAWTSNRLKRSVLRPKRYLIDPGLIAGILRVDVGGVMRESDLIGRVLDTLVVFHLRSEVASSATRPRLYHLRTQGGRQEIDVVAELAGGGLVGIEVKATSSPRLSDAKHLGWLRERFPDRFLGGVVLHTGPRSFRLDDHIVAASISTFWA